MSQTKAQLIDPVDLSIVTADLADDAVTADKLASNAVVSASIVDGSIVNADINASAAIAASKIADFVSLGNTNNRVLTATGTANSLNGEANLTFDGATLNINGTSTDTPLILDTSNSSGSHLRFRKDGANKHFFGSGGGFGLGDVDDLSLRTTDNIIFGVSTTEKMRLNSDGDLLVGRTSTIDTSEVLGIKGPSGDHCTFGITTDGTTNLGIIAFNDNDANFRGQIRYSHSGDVMQFHAAGSERINVSADGIKFNGDTAATNALDDYEEGTFTGGIQDFNGTYTANTGVYTKIGNVVTIQIMIQGNGGSGSGALKLTSLPFNSENSPVSYRAVGSIHAHQGVVTGGVQVTALMNNNDNKVNIRTFQNNANTTDLNRNGLNSGGWELVIGMVYHTAA